MKTKLIAKIYRLLQARQNCLENNNTDWYEKHTDSLISLAGFLPHGSGIDNGCKIDINDSNENKIVITFGFHHLNENGYYEGWTDHKLILKPTFDGFDMKITGYNKNQVKDYLYDTFDYCLNEEIEFNPVN